MQNGNGEGGLVDPISHDLDECIGKGEFSRRGCSGFETTGSDGFHDPKLRTWQLNLLLHMYREESELQNLHRQRGSEFQTSLKMNNLGLGGSPTRLDACYSSFRGQHNILRKDSRGRHQRQ
jgi:hypothetical protein